MGCRLPGGCRLSVAKLRVECRLAVFSTWCVHYSLTVFLVIGLLRPSRLNPLSLSAKLFPKSRSAALPVPMTLA